MYINLYIFYYSYVCLYACANKCILIDIYTVHKKIIANRVRKKKFFIKQQFLQRGFSLNFCSERKNLIYWRASLVKYD